MSWIRKHLTFANVVSVMALFLALAGTGYAAATLARNSVGTKQLKKNAVTSPKVKNHSLKAVDFAAGQIPAGAPGTPGEATGYARVAADGTLLPLVPATNPDFPAMDKNVTAANITHTAASGVYCFTGLPFKVASALVSSDNAGASAANQNNFVVSVAVERGNGLGGCAAGTQARVVATTWTDATAPANADHGFIIWFEK
jgi:hypothetical protein